MSKRAAPSDDLTDHVDVVIDQWARERPDVDVSAMAIIGRLSRLDAAIRARLDVVFDAHGLESWEFDVLATLRRNGEPHQLTPGQLLDSMMITSGTMTNRINRLERRGYVRRSPDPEDGRQVLVALTQEGLDVVDVALVDHAENGRSIVSGLDAKQRSQLVELLRQLGLSIGSEAATNRG